MTQVLVDSQIATGLQQPDSNASLRGAASYVPSAIYEAGICEARQNAAMYTDAIVTPDPAAVATSETGSIAQCADKTSSSASSRVTIIRADVKYLSSILIQLAELGYESSGDDDAQPATEWAIDTASNLAVDASIILGLRNTPLPDAFVSSDDVGGLRIEWIRGTRNVHLCVPRGATSNGFYLYSNDCTPTEILSKPKAEDLADRLQTIIN